MSPRPLARPSPQVARTMAPSVIYIDEAEKVFITDKKKLREFGSQVRPLTLVHVIMRLA